MITPTVDEGVETVLRPAERKLFAKGVHHISADPFEVVDNLTVDV